MMVGLLFAHIFLKKKKSEIHKTIAIFYKLRMKKYFRSYLKKTNTSDVFLTETLEIFVN